MYMHVYWPKELKPYLYFSHRFTAKTVILQWFELSCKIFSAEVKIFVLCIMLDSKFVELFTAEVNTFK